MKRRVRDLQRRDVRVLRYQPQAADEDAPFTPASLSGLQLWLDGADEATKTLNGSNVSAWLDKSGNARDASQGTAANQPANVSGGAPAAGVDFAASSRVLALASAMSYGAAATIAVVCTAVTVAPGYVISDNAGGAASSILSGHTATGDLEWFNTATDRLKFVDDPVAGTRFRLTLTQTNGASLIGYVNGGQVFSKLPPGVTLGDLRFIGAANAGPASPYRGVIHEIIVYDRVLTADEITSLETYLARWA